MRASARRATPRFAGIGYGGRVTVAAAEVTLEGRFGWVLVDYRWINSEHNQAEAGSATFICEQKTKGWRIVHVHSSHLLQWDRYASAGRPFIASRILSAVLGLTRRTTK